jgi:hypothetical protein
MLRLTFRQEDPLATKTVTISDISGKDIPDEEHATILVIEHPSVNGSVELDVSNEEAAKFESTSTELVHLIVRQGNRAPRQVAIELGAFNSLFGGKVDMAAVVGNARKAGAEGTKRRGRPAGSKAAPKGDRLDFTAPENYGRLHRGRVTEAEAALVRDNREQASKNREAQTGSPIDFNDAAEQKRYGM